MRNEGKGPVLAASLVFAGATLLFGAAVLGAVRTGEAEPFLDPVEVSQEGLDQTVPETNAQSRTEPLGGDSSGTPEVDRPWAEPQDPPASTYPLVSQEEILAAVNQDLFQPDRTPVPDRYVLPGFRSETEAIDRNDRRRREPDLRIVGTAMAGNLGIALVQLDDSIPLAVVVGEEVDGFILAAVDQGSATLVDESGAFTFPVVEQDRRASSSARDGRSRGDSRGQEDAARVLNERIQQMLQRMNRGQVGPGGGGGTMVLPVRVQELQRAGGLPGNVIIRTQPGGGGGSRP